MTLYVSRSLFLSLSFSLEHKKTYLALCLQPPVETLKYVFKRWFQSVEQVPGQCQVTNQ